MSPVLLHIQSVAGLFASRVDTAPSLLFLNMTEEPKMQLSTYMSVVHESMFAGNLISLLRTSRYVNSPCVGVDLLTQSRCKARNQQGQQRPK